MKALLPLLLAAAPAWAARKTPGQAFLPQWREGQAWAVEYLIRSPSAAGVENPPDEIRTEVWEYSMLRPKDGAGGWILKVWERNFERNGHYQVTFTTAIAVLKVERYDSRGDAREVFNDSDKGGYRSDSTRAPLLDWPVWGSGVPENGAWVFRFDVPGRDGFHERIRWLKNSVWWFQAERSYGAVAVKARLL